MWVLFRKIIKFLAAALAVVAIFVFVGLGTFQFLLTQLPNYQSEIQDWVRDALGLTLRFSHLDASWTLSGPELIFYQASIGDGGLSVGEASINLNAIKLLTRRQLIVDELILQGTHITVEQTSEGLRLQGITTENDVQVEINLEDIPPVRVVVRNSSVLYVDQTRGESLWQFDSVTMTLDRDDKRILLEARVDVPHDLGSRIELSVEGELQIPGISDNERWRLFIDLRQVDLAELAQLLPNNNGALPGTGMGDFSLWLYWQQGELLEATAQLAASNLVLVGTNESGWQDFSYDNVDLTAEWSRADRGWQLALSNVNVARNGRVWPDDSHVDLKVGVGSEGLDLLGLRANFLRLEDIGPFVNLLPKDLKSYPWAELAPQGDLVDVALDLIQTTGERWEYQLAAGLRDVGIQSVNKLPGFSGLTGDLRTDERSGRFNIFTEDLQFDWLTYFREPLKMDLFSGIVLWRRGQSNIRLVSDDLVLESRDGSINSDLELTIPIDNGSPYLEMELDIARFNAASLKRYIPAHRMPLKVVDWLDRAIVAGQIKEGRLSFIGFPNDFPFDGAQGEFRGFARVEDGIVQFMEDWPPAQDLNGTMEFFNSSFKSHGSGRISRHRTSDFSVAFEDFREGTIAIKTVSDGSLEDFVTFMKDVPMIIDYLGPDLGRLNSGSGRSEVSVDLSLPLRNPGTHDLEASLKIFDGELFVEGFSPRVTEINGMLSLHQGVVTGDKIEANFLDGPFLARVVPTDELGYRARLDFGGEVDAEDLGAAFDMPFLDYLDGRTQWRGALFLPARLDESEVPLKMNLASDLSGLAFRLPDPMFKTAGEQTNFNAEFLFSPNQLKVQGTLGLERRFALNFLNMNGGLVFDRGGVSFGGSDPLLPLEQGLLLQGHLPLLRLDDWLGIFRSASSGTWPGIGVFDANLMVMEFSAFGQRLGNTDLSVSRVRRQWFVDIESEAVAGKLVLPPDLSSREQILANMSRLHLSPRDGTSMEETDPRDLPGFLIQSGQFSIGSRHFGRLAADIRADPLGLRVHSLKAANESFALGGEGSWFEGISGSDTHLTLTLNSSDVADTLTALGFGPVAEGQQADLMADIFWSGPPSTDWSEHLNGSLAIHMQEGSVLDLEPGAGRMVGLMSITALPRRLALDFRDVFSRGLVFDELTGDFVIIDGDAYTDNFKLTGPAAEIGVVGRTGLRNRDWQQLAVVTAEPGNMLPTVGAILGGGGVGAALLIFTQIFKEPLKGIGRASYCLTGTWDEPVVQQLLPEDLEEGRLCAGAPPGGFSVANP